MYLENDMVSEDEVKAALHFAFKKRIKALVLACLSAVFLTEFISSFSSLNVISGTILLFFLYKMFHHLIQSVYRDEYAKNAQVIAEHLKELTSEDD
jgi:hypothetical protein